jgi:hypothetical protein
MLILREVVLVEVVTVSCDRAVSVPHSAALLAVVLLAQLAAVASCLSNSDTCQDELITASCQSLYCI